MKDDVVRDVAQDSAWAGGILDAWRMQGADRVAPTRFRYLVALQRRTAGQEGQARRLLEGRLSALVDAYAADVEAAASANAEGAEAATTPAAPAPARGPIGELVDRLAGGTASPGGVPAGPAASHAFPEPYMLAELRKLWSRIRARNQLQQSLERAPSGAGPLNSRLLVHRALTLMQDTSPGYAEHFLSYLDTLSWLDRMGEGFSPADRETPRSAGGRKHARERPRRRG